MKVSLNEYLKSPCSVASLPFWKQNNIAIPDNMKIVHEKDFIADNFADFTDEKYFRLFHDLTFIEQSNKHDIELITATFDKLDIFVDIINKSYTDLNVTKEQLESYQKTPVYNSNLWVLLKFRNSEHYIGCGIADYDKEIGELIIEWIQVLPLYRKRGYGQTIVNHLLTQMQGIAKFATVSGKINNPTNPESLYRKCGFKGNDIWHILYKK